VDNQRYILREEIVNCQDEGKSKKDRKMNVILFNDMVWPTKGNREESVAYPSLVLACSGQAGLLTPGSTLQRH